MAAHARNDATTDINKQVEQQQQQKDNTRMAFAALEASASTPATSCMPQQKRQPEQCNAKILQALLGIVAQPQVVKQQMEGTDFGQEHKQHEQQSHMELSQIELIYRAEGNANLVLALPQFKKVLRLPKTSPLLPSSSGSSSQSSSSRSNIKYNKMKIGNTQQQAKEREERQQQQQQQTDTKLEMEMVLRQQVAAEERQQQCQEQQQQQTQDWQLQHQQKQHELVESASDPAVNQNVKDLTMEDFVAYIEVIRNLLGSEYVFEPEIVRIAKEADRRWINERIRAERPAHRRDKEFCGEFGLLLPDATRLPIAFDILLSNLQAELIGDTYAIEIKPKQGWLLPTDFIEDLLNRKMPTMLEEKTKTTIKISADQIAEDNRDKPTATNSHNARCRYCAMQFLKLRSGKINRRSSYCPLALFSGNRPEMLTAIDALLQCPQNNLRIFRNGILIYDGENDSYKELIENIFPGDQKELLKDLIVACLLKDYMANTNNNNKKDDDNSNNSSGNSSCSSGSSVNCDDANVVSGQPHLSSIPSRRTVAEKQWRKTMEEEVKLKESNVEPTNRVESTHRTTATAAAEQMAGKDLTTTTMAKAKATTTRATIKSTTATTPTPPSATRTSTTTTTAAAPAAALETISQAQITEVEMLCLPKNCVLQKVLHLQLLAKHHMPALRNAGYADKSEKSYNSLRVLLERLRHKKQQQQQQQQQQLPLEMELEPHEAYLLGATALDCSIMLAFQEISLCNQWKEEEEEEEGEEKQSHSHSIHFTKMQLYNHCVNMPRYNKTFLTKITLVDLDPKPDSHLCKYIKQTCQALNLFIHR